MMKMILRSYAVHRFLNCAFMGDSETTHQEWLRSWTEFWIGETLGLFLFYWRNSSIWCFTHCITSRNIRKMYLKTTYSLYVGRTWGSERSDSLNTSVLGSSLGSGRSSGEGHGNPLQYSCLENPMGRGAWWATVHGVTKSDMTERLTLLNIPLLVSWVNLWPMLFWRCSEAIASGVFLSSPGFGDNQGLD